MPFKNFENRHFTAEEKALILTKLEELMALLEPKSANLTPLERKKLGSINEINKGFVNKIKEYCEHSPELRSPDIDWIEFMLDYESRAFLALIMDKFETSITKLKNAKILHDLDNSTDSRNDYKYSKLKKEMVPGYENKVNDLAQFFKNRGSGKSDDNEL